MDQAVLDALADKYRELLALRGEAGGAADPTRRLRALAARFPGALRELDRLPLDVLAARLAALLAARDGSAPPPAWAAFCAGYHGWLRAALRVRKAHRGEPRDAAGLARAVARYAAELPDEPPRLTLEDVRAMLAPPGGRLAPWALGRVARDHGVPEAAVRAALFA